MIKNIIILLAFTSLVLSQHVLEPGHTVLFNLQPGESCSYEVTLDLTQFCSFIIAGQNLEQKDIEWALLDYTKRVVDEGIYARETPASTVLMKKGDYQLEGFCNGPSKTCCFTITICAKDYYPLKGTLQIYLQQRNGDYGPIYLDDNLGQLVAFSQAYPWDEEDFGVKAKLSRYLFYGCSHGSGEQVVNFMQYGCDGASFVVEACHVPDPTCGPETFKFPKSSEQDYLNKLSAPFAGTRQAIYKDDCVGGDCWWAVAVTMSQQHKSFDQRRNSFYLEIKPLSDFVALYEDQACSDQTNVCFNDVFRYYCYKPGYKFYGVTLCDAERDQYIDQLDYRLYRLHDLQMSFMGNFSDDYYRVMNPHNDVFLVLFYSAVTEHHQFQIQIENIENLVFILDDANGDNVYFCDETDHIFAYYRIKNAGLTALEFTFTSQFPCNIFTDAALYVNHCDDDFNCLFPHPLNQCHQLEIKNMSAVATVPWKAAPGEIISLRLQFLVIPDPDFTVHIKVREIFQIGGPEKPEDSSSWWWLLLLLLLFIIIIAVVWYCCKKKKSNSSSEKDEANKGGDYAQLQEKNKDGK